MHNQSMTDMKPCIDALKAVMALIESGDLVRNTDNDNNNMFFLKQGLRITQVLVAAQAVIDADTDKPESK